METLVFDREIISRSTHETENLAAQFYSVAGKIALVALYGPLGAGKTSFVRGVAKAAGVAPEDVNSPSFTYINEYPGGETPVYHFDLYRLKDPAEFHSIGGYDYLNREAIILIEWAENGGDFIPRDRYDVRFRIIDETSRGLAFSKVGL
jgi:tRNA threonylcarbamoyladenosine biosynthesis protein TsaE